MRIQTILNEVNNSNAAILLENTWNDLTFKQKIQINIIEKELKPLFDNLLSLFLVERELSKEEIYSIFDKAIEKKDEEGNRTRLGKLKDLTTTQIEKLKELDKKIIELGSTIQNTEKVKDFDKKFKELEQKILVKYKDTKVVKLLNYLRAQAKEKPNASLLIIGIVTASAGILSGPIGGAAAGFISSTIVKLLQEEKFSTAIGTSLKAAMFGSFAQLTFIWITNEIIENITYAKYDEVKNMQKSIKTTKLIPLNDKLLTRNEGLVKFLHADTLSTYALSGTVNNFNYNYDLIVTPQLSDNIVTLQNEISTQKMFSEEFYKATMRFHDYLARIQNSPLQSIYRSVIEAISRINDKGNVLNYENLTAVVGEYDSIQSSFNALTKWKDIFGGLLQTGVQQATELKNNMFEVGPADHVEEENPPSLPESLDVADTLLEESIFSDAVEKLKNAGKNITNIVTKDKLIKTWEKAGKPLDSEMIIKILSVYFEPSISSKIVNTFNVKELPASDSPETKAVSKNDKLDKIVDSIKNSSESQKVIEYIKNKIK